MALQDYVKKIQAVRGDFRLTPKGQADKIEPLSVAAVDSLVDEYKVCTTVSNELEADRKNLFDPPPLRPGDAAQALLDREAREWFIRLSPDDRGKVIPKLLAGLLPTVALALVRSPVPLFSDEEMANKAWKASVEVQKNGEVQLLEINIEGLEATQLAIVRLAQSMTKAGGLSDQAVFQILKMLNAPNAGPFKNTGYVQGVARPVFSKAS